MVSTVCAQQLNTLKNTCLQKLRQILWIVIKYFSNTIVDLNYENNPFWNYIIFL